MSEYTSVRSLFRETPADQAVLKVSGWVRTVRDGKTFAFIELNDGTFFKNLQVVCDDTLANFAEIVKITTGSAIEVEGRLLLTPERKQPFELHADSVTVVGLCDADYPLQKKRHSFEYLRTQAHLRRARTPSTPCSASVRSRRRLSTASSRKKASSTCILRSSPPATRKAPEKCSA